MNDFFLNIESVRPSIPADVYKPIKRCLACHSVYLTETRCEACGRSLKYHQIGEPFSGKSYFGIKERYNESLPLIVRLYPFFENIESPEAFSLIKHLVKRFDDLLLALASDGLIENENRRFFYIEILAIADTLHDYSFDLKLLETKLENTLMENAPMLYQVLKEKINEIIEGKSEILKKGTWTKRMLSHKLWGVLQIEFLLTAVLFSSTSVVLSYLLFDFLNSQGGK